MTKQDFYAPGIRTVRSIVTVNRVYQSWVFFLQKFFELMM